MQFPLPNNIHTLVQRNIILHPFTCYYADMTGPAPFKECGSCHKKWEEWQDFVRDPEVRLLGFQGSTRLPDTNLLVFHHRCGTSISVFAKNLRHILPQDVQELQFPVLYGDETCSQYCREIENLKICKRSCANARDRHLILTILEMKKG
jgi:hypothetical protein